MLIGLVCVMALCFLFLFAVSVLGRGVLVLLALPVVLVIALWCIGIEELLVMLDGWDKAGKAAVERAEKRIQANSEPPEPYVPYRERIIKRRPRTPRRWRHQSESKPVQEELSVPREPAQVPQPELTPEQTEQVRAFMLGVTVEQLRAGIYTPREPLDTAAQQEPGQAPQPWLTPERIEQVRAFMRGVTVEQPRAGIYAPRKPLDTTAQR
jgi:hypothetical protein